METREYRTTDKSAWGNGPWLDEPDKKQWQDPETGLPCLVVRGPSGALCGYVGVSKEHPTHGIGYWPQNYDDDCNPIPMTATEQAVIDLEVHGGLTFAKGCGHSGDESAGICHVPALGEPDDVWWFGFDCAHAGDYTPGSAHRLPAHLRENIGDPTGWGSTVQYRTLAYVEGECRNLARQLAAIGVSP